MGPEEPVLPTVPRARCCDVVLVRELPYGSAAMLHQEAGQMAASDYMHPLSKTACIFKGVHRWVTDLRRLILLTFAFGSFTAR